MGNLQFGFYLSPFGQCFIVFTNEKVFALLFLDNIKDAEKHIRENLKSLEISENQAAADEFCQKIFFDENAHIEASVSGTEFQRQVWRELLKIPAGEMRTYQQIANAIGKSSAVRAVANAIGANPLAYIIPCHRVIRTDGRIGGYRWGIDVKKRILMEEFLNRK